jgi:hypothetical protein
MSTVNEIKEAAAKLTAEQRAELLRWLAEFELTGQHAAVSDWFAQWQRLNATVEAAVGERHWKRDDLHAR